MKEFPVTTAGLRALWPPGKGWKLSYPQLPTSNTFEIIIIALGRCGLHHGREVLRVRWWSLYLYSIVAL